MPNDLLWAEWEMDYRVTGAHAESQRDRLARLCSEAQEPEPASRRRGGDLQQGKLACLARQLRAVANQVLRPLAQEP